MPAALCLPVAALLVQQASAGSAHVGHDAPMTMTGTLGGYSMSRDASGTSWQPDAAPHRMGHLMRGDWSLMGHAVLDAVYDRQQGPRGGELAFLSGMVMGSARRDFADHALTFRAMLSPDPFMGRRGYPLLLAAGETANGATPLVDRQHPHDLFMELSATLAWKLDSGRGAYIYAGLPGEPAFGPPAFMHRPAAIPSPEAPITHHWLDSTHITFGVLTAGWIRRAWKFELTQFTGREPDQDRYDLERPRFDSTAVRATWNPGRNWSLQGSWADLESPEQLEPAVDEQRISASALYARDHGDGRSWSATIAWGRKDPTEGASTDALTVEAALVPASAWQLFARAEWLETHELGEGHQDVDRVGKVSIGALREFSFGGRIRFGLGALYSRNRVGSALRASYGGSPDGLMVFLRLSAGA